MFLYRYILTARSHIPTSSVTFRPIMAIITSRSFDLFTDILNPRTLCWSYPGSTRSQPSLHQLWVIYDRSIPWGLSAASGWILRLGRTCPTVPSLVTPSPNAVWEAGPSELCEGGERNHCTQRP